MSENWNALRHIQDLEAAIKSLLIKADEQFICRCNLAAWKEATQSERILIGTVSRETQQFIEQGRNEMLEQIRATLKSRAEGFNTGGDIEVMQFVDAIVKRELTRYRIWIQSGRKP
jgi:hypothetical protein